MSRLLEKAIVTGTGVLGLALIATTVAGEAAKTHGGTTANAQPETALVTRRDFRLTSANAYIQLPGETTVTCALNDQLSIANTSTQHVEAIDTPPDGVVRTDLTLVNGSTTERRVELQAPSTAIGETIDCEFMSDGIASTVKQHDIPSLTRDAAADYTQARVDDLVPQPTKSGTEVYEAFVIPSDQHNMYDAKFPAVYFTFTGSTAQPIPETPTPSK